MRASRDSCRCFSASNSAFRFSRTDTLVTCLSVCMQPEKYLIIILFAFTHNIVEPVQISVTLCTAVFYTSSVCIDLLQTVRVYVYLFICMCVCVCVCVCVHVCGPPENCYSASTLVSDKTCTLHSMTHQKMKTLISLEYIYIQQAFQKFVFSGPLCSACRVMLVFP